jgi:hypothetical protein
MMLLYFALLVALSVPRTVFPYGIGVVGVGILVWAEYLVKLWLGIGLLLFFLHLYGYGSARLSLLFAGLPRYFWYLLTTLGIWALCFFAFLPGALVLLVCFVVTGTGMESLISLVTSFSMGAWFAAVEAYGGIMILVLVIFGIAIIPPFYVSAIYMFAPILVVDKEMSAAEALEASARMTRGGRMGIINFMVVCSLVNLAGVLSLLVGLLVAVPIVQFATIWLYAYLLRQTEHQLGYAIGEPGILNAELEP